MKITGKHRILSLVLSFLMVLSVVPVTAFAAEDSDPQNAVVSESGTDTAADSEKVKVTEPQSGASEEVKATEPQGGDSEEVKTTEPQSGASEEVKATEPQSGDSGNKNEVEEMTQLTDYVTVSGIKGFENTKFATFADAYAAIKPLVATLGLGQETPADTSAFDAVFTDVTNGRATLTYTITGNVTYDETEMDHLLTMGRKSSHYLTNERHLINFKFVGAEDDRKATHDSQQQHHTSL